MGKEQRVGHLCTLDTYLVVVFFLIYLRGFMHSHKSNEMSGRFFFDK